VTPFPNDPALSTSGGDRDTAFVREQRRPVWLRDQAGWRDRRTQMGKVQGVQRAGTSAAVVVAIWYRSPLERPRGGDVLPVDVRD
jgi:hypothetical protein